MKKGYLKKMMAAVLCVSLFLTGAAGTKTKVFASETAGNGKYVSDVFIAYGKTADEAAAWLEQNGWEPIKGDRDFNAGKNSAFDDPVAAVMGIKRTDKKDEAITDMAVMNMKGGYSLEDYKTLVKEKETEINEFIDSFIPVLQEYRKNYNGEGSALGKKRADLVYDLLNRFYDGDPKDRYAVNDTGKPLGELFLEKTKREMELDNENYEDLPREEQLKHADLTQIILESSGPAVLAIQQLLALAADASEDTWLERLQGLTGDGLIENLEKYVPEAKGQDVAPSAAIKYLETHYGDIAEDLAIQWNDIHEEMVWLEKYCEDNDLWPGAKETEEAYNKRTASYFEALKKKDEERYNTEYGRFNTGNILYNSLYETEYEGKWGETLGDFFNPAEGGNYGRDPQYFLTFAAAMSEGQRAASELISLQNLIYVGMADEAGLNKALPDLKKVFGDDLTMSVYTGINRGIFRNGVALTNRALMEQNQGRGRAFDQMWDNLGIMAISSYAAAAVGAVTFIAGAVMVAKGKTTFVSALPQVEIDKLSRNVQEAQSLMKKGIPGSDKLLQQAKNELNNARTSKTNYTRTSEAGVAGRWVMGIGGALMVLAAAVKAWQMVEYYDRTFVPIPTMIVDEADIVTFVTNAKGKQVLNEDGKPVKNVQFDQYVYYDAVRCNRDLNNPLSDWQNGVSRYFEDGCGDVADLNGDFGQEWLALYTVKNQKKGDPILADSLKLQYGSDAQPKGTTKALHLFTYTDAVDLGDTAWSFNNKQNGIYFFWDEEQGAFNDATASVFSRGQMAMAGAAGLILGILGATLILLPRKKKEEAEAEA